MNWIWNIDSQIEKHPAQEQYPNIFFDGERNINFTQVYVVFHQYAIFTVHQQIHPSCIILRFTFRPIFSLLDKINKIK